MPRTMCRLYKCGLWTLQVWTVECAEFTSVDCMGFISVDCGLCGLNKCGLWTLQLWTVDFKSLSLFNSLEIDPYTVYKH